MKQLQTRRHKNRYVCNQESEKERISGVNDTIKGVESIKTFVTGKENYGKKRKPV